MEYLASAPFRSAKPGDIITFGTYPQSSDGADRSPILWRVPQNSGRELFLLSEYILDCRRYHGESVDMKWRDSVDITWHDCDLRKWLNNEFYNTAFNATEKEFIKTTHCADNGEVSPDTEDKVFCLALRRSRSYLRFTERSYGAPLERILPNRKNDGCDLYVYDKANQDNYIIRNGEEVGCSWWWSRTQGNKPSRAFLSVQAAVFATMRM